METVHQVGDKVAVKNRDTNLRGVIVDFKASSIVVQTPTGTVEADARHVTNYSAAARKAWSKQPRRRVGRPRGATVDRVTVNLRIDRDVWLAFQTAETQGLITTRTETINKWLREGLKRLQRGSASER